MPTSTFMPDITAEVAFATAPDDPAPEWVDVSAYVEASSAIGISRGRSDELSEVQPSRVTVTLDNSDGRFTPGNASSPYYPKVTKSRQIRINARWPLGQSGNLFTPNQASMETSIGDWVSTDALGTMTPAALASSTLHPQDGTKGLQITWPTTAIPSASWTVFSGLVAGRVYTASAYVWVPSGDPDPRMEVLFVAGGTRTSVKNALQRISVTFTATQTEHSIGVQVASATSGDLCFVDAAQLDEGSTVGAFTTSPPPIYQRFTGYVDEWPVAWPNGTDEYAHATISASSRRSRLAAGKELKSLVEHEILTDGPTAYYPLSEPKGRSAGDVSGNQQPPLEAAGEGPGIQWGEGTGPGTDGLPAPIFDDGRFLIVTETWPPLFDEPTQRSYTLEVFVATEDSGTQRGAPVIWGGDAYVYLGINTTGKATAVSGQLGQTPAWTLTSSAAINDGEVHHIAVRVTYGLSDVTADLYLDGVEVDTETVNDNLPGVKATYWNLHVAKFLATDGADSGGWKGSVAHVAMTSRVSGDQMEALRIAAHAEAGLTGFEGERSDERIERLAGYADVTVDQLNLEVGQSVSMAAQATAGRIPIDLMQEATNTEGGLLFDAGDGTLVFHSRAHRYNTDPVITLDAGQQHIEASLEAKLDGQQLVNDIVASRPDGPQFRAFNTASIDEHDAHRAQVEILTTSDDEVVDAANWRIQRYGEPDVRIYSVSVDLLNSSTSMIAALLAAELGDRITLANLPDQAPAPTMDGYIDGINETIGAESYTVALELTPAAIYDVWELDSASLSQLDQTTVLAY